MAGLHECGRCGYRFEDGPSLEQHEYAGCEGFEAGQPTGRTFLVDSSDGGEIIGMSTNGSQFPEYADDAGHDLAVWTEYKDADGDLWYVSDHEEYTLDAEEFGPIPEEQA
jgi:hypothetical protein